MTGVVSGIMVAFKQVSPNQECKIGSVGIRVKVQGQFRLQNGPFLCAGIIKQAPSEHAWSGESECHVTVRSPTQ